MSNPLISVVIPSYNRAELIANTLRSVLAQDFSDFEILVVDDGSKDATREAVEAVGDQRIRYIAQANAGANAARNNGIRQARGQYIAMLDADDTFLPTHLSESLSAAREHPGCVIYGRIIVDRGNGQTFHKPPRSVDLGEPISEYLMCAQGFVQTSTLFLDAKVAQSVGYLEGLANGQDIDFAIRLEAAGYSFYMLEKPSVIWRDFADPKRISSGSNPFARLAWLETVKPLVTVKAWHGYRGWFVAKSFSQQGKVSQALGLYSQAVLHGAYKPALAAKIGVQVLLSGSGYRKVTALYLGLKAKLR